MFDPEQFGQAMGKAIKEAVAPLLTRLEALEKQSPVELPVLPDIGELVKSEVVARLAELPLPKPSDFDQPIKQALDALVKEVRDDLDKFLVDSGKQLSEAISGLATPENGKDGVSPTVEDVRPMVERMFEQSIADLTHRTRKQVEELFESLPDPVGLAGALVDRSGNLQITLSNGTVKDLGPVVGRDGVDLSDVKFIYDGERTLTAEGKGGSIKFFLPIPLDTGYWREGMSSEKGDIVTHDGSAWLALKPTKEKPSTQAKEDWRLFARKGRDGESSVKAATSSGPVRLGSTP